MMGGALLMVAGAAVFLFILGQWREWRRGAPEPRNFTELGHRLSMHGTFGAIAIFGTALFLFGVMAATEA